MRSDVIILHAFGCYNITVVISIGLQNLHFLGKRFCLTHSTQISLLTFSFSVDV